MLRALVRPFILRELGSTADGFLRRAAARQDWPRVDFWLLYRNLATAAADGLDAARAERERAAALAALYKLHAAQDAAVREAADIVARARQRDIAERQAVANRATWAAGVARDVAANRAFDEQRGAAPAAPFVTETPVTSHGLPRTVMRHLEELDTPVWALRGVPFFRHLRLGRRPKP